MFSKKFRIREIGGYFTPQYRFSFFTWKYFRNYEVYSFYGNNCYKIVDFRTLKEAEEFLSIQTEVIHTPKKQSNSNFSLFSFGNCTQQNIRK